MMKGGLGSASEVWGNYVVGAIVAVNAAGDVIDPETRAIVAGARNPAGGMLFETSVREGNVARPKGNLPSEKASDGPHLSNGMGNTTIAVVATDAALTKAQASKVAQMAHNGLAEVLRPAHTMFDGDTVFALALGERGERAASPDDAAYRTSMLGAVAARVLARAIVKGVLHASELHGIRQRARWRTGIKLWEAR